MDLLYISKQSVVMKSLFDLYY